MSVQCPKCQREPGQRCHDERANQVPTHRERFRAAIKTSCPLIDSFLTYLRAERGATENTIASYESDLLKFADWLDQQQSRHRDRKTLTNTERSDVRDYLAEALAAGASGRTAARRLASLRLFFHFLMDEDKIEQDPTRNLPVPKTWKTIPQSLSTADLDRMVASLGTSPLDIRDKAMLLTFFGSGLRESELAALKLKDIDLDTGIVKVWNGKGGKDGLVPLSSLSIDAIKQYLDQVRPGFASRGKSAHLFLGRRGRPLTRQQVRNRVHDVAKAVLEQSVSPINLRHGFATALIEGEADLRDVQVLMRHSHIGNTEVYVHTDINYLRRFYAKHPRSAVVADDQAVPDVSRRAQPQPEHGARLSKRSRRVG